MRLLKLILVVILLSCCAKDNIFKDDELHLEKVPYTGDELRIDGYYYSEFGDEDDKLRDVYFFYRNGNLLYGSTYSSDLEDKKEEEYTTEEWQSIVKESKQRWGVFQIEGTKILFERWYPSQPPLKAYVREGEILNDTTFKITQSYRMKDGEKTERKDRDETFNFKEFSPKPDSTNKFVD